MSTCRVCLIQKPQMATLDDIFDKRSVGGMLKYCSGIEA
jgi:hypothetical protein